MELTEILKYLSPVALLGLIWAVFQFFQKRRFEKEDFAQKENIDSYKILHSKVNHIKIEYFKLITLLQQATMFERSKLKTYKELRLTNEVLIEETQKKTRIAHLRIKTEIAKNKKISNQILQSSIKTEENKNKLIEIHEKSEILNKELLELGEQLNYASNKVDEYSAIFDLKNRYGDESFDDKIKSISENLQNKIFDLNNIPLLAVKSKEKPHELIAQLTENTQNVVNIFSVVNDINERNFTDTIEIKSIENSLILLDQIEEHIYLVLK